MIDPATSWFEIKDFQQRPGEAGKPVKQEE